jgi:hypothetical protein
MVKYLDLEALLRGLSETRRGLEEGFDHVERHKKVVKAWMRVLDAREQAGGPPFDLHLRGFHD